MPFRISSLFLFLFFVFVFLGAGYIQGYIHSGNLTCTPDVPDDEGGGGLDVPALAKRALRYRRQGEVVVRLGCRREGREGARAGEEGARGACEGKERTGHFATQGWRGDRSVARMITFLYSVT